MCLFSFSGNNIHPRSENTAFTQQSDKHVFAITACNVKCK